MKTNKPTSNALLIVRGFEIQKTERSNNLAVIELNSRTLFENNMTGIGCRYKYFLIYLVKIKSFFFFKDIRREDLFARNEMYTRLKKMFFFFNSKLFRNLLCHISYSFFFTWITKLSLFYVRVTRGSEKKNLPYWLLAELAPAVHKCSA